MCVRYSGTMESRKVVCSRNIARDPYESSSDGPVKAVSRGCA